MVKFTKKSFIIEVETMSPVEDLIELQAAILDLSILNRYNEITQNDTEIQNLVADSNAWHTLLTFARDISFSHEINEDIHNKITKVLSAKKTQNKE